MWYVDVGERGVIYALTMAIFYTVIWGSQFHNTPSIDNRKTVSLNSEYKSFLTSLNQCTVPQNFKLRSLRLICFDLVKACEGVFLLCFLGQIVTWQFNPNLLD